MKLTCILEQKSSNPSAAKSLFPKRMRSPPFAFIRRLPRPSPRNAGHLDHVTSILNTTRLIPQQSQLRKNTHFSLSLSRNLKATGLGINKPRQKSKTPRVDIFESSHRAESHLQGWKGKRKGPLRILVGMGEGERDRDCCDNKKVMRIADSLEKPSLAAVKVDLRGCSISNPRKRKSTEHRRR